MRRVLVVSNGVIGTEMAGPGIRYVNLARELAGSFRVTLAAPNETDLRLEGVEVVRVDPTSASAMTQLGSEHAAVFAQRLPIRTMLHLARTPVRVVYDLYDPVLFESLAGSSRAGGRGGAGTVTGAGSLLARYEHLVQEVVLGTGDSFACASERQRDLWIGWLAALGRLDSDEHDRDPTLRSLIDVVPFGIETEAPRHTGPVVRGVLPGVTADSRVLLWGGGIWDWFDPLTVIRATVELAARRPNIRLVFMGGGRPGGEAVEKEMAMAGRARALAAELEALDGVVVFNDRWVPYHERGGWLAEADLGLSAHFADVETRFAFRTRLLDYLWAGLPIVATRGDVLGDLVESHSLGKAVDVEDVGGWVEALDELLGDDRRRAEARRNAIEVREQFTWPRVAGRLAELLAEPGRRVTSGPTAWLTATREREIRARLSLEYRGTHGMVRHAVDQALQNARRASRG